MPFEGFLIRSLELYCEVKFKSGRPMVAPTAGKSDFVGAGIARPLIPNSELNQSSA